MNTVAFFHLEKKEQNSSNLGAKRRLDPEPTHRSLQTFSSVELALFSL